MDVSLITYFSFQNDTIGHLVIQAHAIDRDQGQNRIVSYMFSQSTQVKLY